MMRLLFLVFIISLNSYSQSIDLGDIREIRVSHLIPEKNELYVFKTDSLLIVNIENLQAIENLKINYPSDQFLTKYEVVSLNSEIHFIEIHGGGVYKLQGNELVRIDNSYTHRMQMGSTLFVHENTIYKYGGYGFWSMRNFFTYFDNSTSEWQLISPTGSKSLPKGSQNSIIKTVQDEVHIYGGLSLNKFEPLKYEFNDEVWKFNLKNKSWKLLGKTKFGMNEFLYNFPYQQNHILYNRDEDHIYVVDVLNNTLKTFKKKKFQYGLNNSFSLYKDGVFYCFLKPFSSDSVTLIKRYEDDFFGELIKEEQFYYNYEWIYYTIGFLLLGLFFTLSYFQVLKFNKRRNKIIIENDSLVFKNKILDIDKKCISILRLLVNSEKEVFSKDIMKITENLDLNYGHNTRVMNNTIEEINFKLKSILGSENDIITFKKSESDKRIKVYSIDKSQFFIKRTS